MLPAVVSGPWGGAGAGAGAGQPLAPRSGLRAGMAGLSPRCCQPWAIPKRWGRLERVAEGFCGLEVKVPGNSWVPFLGFPTGFVCPDGQKLGFQQAGGGCRSLPCSRLLFLFSWCSSGAVGQSGQRLHLHLERMLLACYAEGAALRKPFPGVVLCGKHLAGLPGGRGEKCCFPSWGRQQGCPLCLCLCLCPAGWLQKAPAWLRAWGWGLPAGKQLKPRAFGQAGRGVRGGENLSALPLCGQGRPSAFDAGPPRFLSRTSKLSSGP